MSQQEIVAMYETDWLARKIVDIIPQDMTREWRTWQHKRAEALYDAEKQFRFRHRVRRGVTLGRLFGGGAILIGKGDKYPDEPLDVTTIKQGGLKYLHAFSRHQLSTEDYVTDLNDPAFGQPLYYRISPANVGQSAERDLRDVKIHRSRFVFFPGLEPADEMFAAEAGWGTPLFQIVRSAIIHAGASPANAAALTEEAKVDLIKIPNLHALISDDEGVQRIVERLTLANVLKSNVNMLILGGDEEFDRKQLNLAGFADLIHVHLQIACGAADIPVTRLLGQSPAGLNATGESDLRNYYDKLRGHQNTDLTEEIDRLDEALIRHVMGSRPLSATYEWTELWQPTEQERATTFNVKMDGITKLNGLGLLAPEELRPAVIDMLIDDGTLPTLDQYRMPDEEAAALIEERAQPPAEPGAEPGGPAPGSRSLNPPGLKVVQGGRKDGATVDEGLHNPFQDLEDAWAQEDVGFARYEEQEHPRGHGGKWTNKSGGGGAKPTGFRRVQASAKRETARGQATVVRAGTVRPAGGVRGAGGERPEEQSSSYARRGGADAARAGGHRGAVAVYEPTGEPRADGRPSPQLTWVESKGEEAAQDYHAAIGEAKASTRFGASVMQYPEEDYRGMRLFLTPDKMAGFALKGDDVVSAFRHTASDHKNTATEVLRLAVEQGGRRLDAFDTVLPSMYAQAGFRAVARTKFNEAFAPEGWNKDVYKKFNNGKPDVVFMAYDPERATEYTRNDGVLIDDYDEGAKHQKAAVEEARKARGEGPSPQTAQAADLLTQHHQPDVTAEEIIAKYPGAEERIAEVVQTVATMTPTDGPVEKGGHVQPDGSYTPERVALHRQILAQLLSPEAVAQATPDAGEPPTMTLLGGRGGSGKSWLTRPPTGPVDAERAFYINSDDIQAMLPDYETWKAGLYHEEASHIAGLAKEIAREAGLSLVLDATMRSPKFAKDIAAFREKGYRVEAHYMFAAPHQAAERAVGRFMRGDRYVPPAYSLSSTTNEASFDQVKDSTDRWSIWDNTGTAPKLYTRGGDWDDDADAAKRDERDKQRRAV